MEFTPQILRIFQKSRSIIIIIIIYIVQNITYCEIVEGKKSQLDSFQKKFFEDLNKKMKCLYSDNKTVKRGGKGH